MLNRIDKELLKRKFVPSRSKAQELIKEGFVKCNGEILTKSNYLVAEEDVLEIVSNDKLKYVSRGGLKLEKAIKDFNVDFKDLRVMDIGSSTGGFCDCALQHGAKSIIAIDVGTDLLHKSLRNNKCIELYEKTNFKNLNSHFFQDIDIITCDVSFISLKQILKKVADEGIQVDAICLIKPQFECGKDAATKYKGVILNKEIHLNIVEDLLTYFNTLGFYMKNMTVSPIKGGDGNIEYLIYLTSKIGKNNQINIDKIVEEVFSKSRLCS